MRAELQKSEGEVREIGSPSHALRPLYIGIPRLFGEYVRDFAD